jgi:hypothetical protein
LREFQLYEAGEFMLPLGRDKRVLAGHSKSP